MSSDAHNDISAKKDVTNANKSINLLKPRPIPSNDKPLHTISANDIFGPSKQQKKKKNKDRQPNQHHQLPAHNKNSLAGAPSLFGKNNTMLVHDSALAATPNASLTSAPSLLAGGMCSLTSAPPLQTTPEKSKRKKNGKNKNKSKSRSVTAADIFGCTSSPLTVDEDSNRDINSLLCAL